MKFIRFGEKGTERPGFVDSQGCLRDLSGVIDDINAASIDAEVISSLNRIDISTLPIVPDGIRLGVPIADVGKIVCIGRNYSEHIAESGHEEPQEPIIFMKVDTSLNGPFDDVIRPKGSRKLDWEVELAVLIGRRAMCVSPESASDYVAGYLVANDISEREFQEERGGQWVKGKGCDTFAPLGPWFVTVDEIPNPQSLGLWLEVNGERHQDSNTANMITSCFDLVAYVSGFMTLNPGDVILTGTPSGVGGAMNPPMYLQPGDRIRAGIDGLGEQSQKIVDWYEIYKT